MQKLLIVAVLLVPSSFHVMAFERSDYVKHVETKADITSAYTWYRVCNPEAGDFTISNSRDFNVTFINAKGAATGSHFEIRANLSSFRNVSERICNPYNSVSSYENGTIVTIVADNCTLIMSERFIEEYSWERFNPTGNIFRANTCYDIKVVGSYPVAYGQNYVNVDNVLGYRGMYFSEYALWLAGWDRRKCINANSTNGSRLNYPLGLFEGTGGPARSMCINITKMDNYGGKQWEIRVVDNQTNATVPFEVISNSTDWACMVMIVNLTNNGNDTFCVYWNNSLAPNMTYSTDFASVGPTSLQVANHQFGFRGSTIQTIDNFSFGRNVDGQELITTMTGDGGVTSNLARDVGSCQFSQINGTVVKWNNCTNGVIGCTYMFAAYNNFTRVVCSGFPSPSTNNDGYYDVCGDGSAAPSTVFYRKNDGTMGTLHGTTQSTQDAAGMYSCGKDAYGTHAFFYYNASWAQSITNSNRSNVNTRETTAPDPIITFPATAENGNYVGNLNTMNIYIGVTGNSTSATHDVWAWLENRPILTVGRNESFIGNASEADGRLAMETGILSSLPNASIYTTQQVYARNLSDSQVLGRFDKVALSGNQRWAFNYITGADSFVNMFNITPALYTLEMSTTNSSQITDTVSKLINNTKQ